MKTFKKVLAVILSIMMIASVIVLPASAETTAQVLSSDYLLTDFETTVTGESAGETCDFAVSGTQATKLAAAHSYKTVRVNKNANYKDAEGISFWVYNAEDSAVSVWANLASTANVGSSGEELYFQRKYTVEPKVWTKLYIKFDYVNKQTAASSTNKKWGFDANNIAYNRAMTDEEIAGITNLYFAVDGGALKTVWFDDVYLWDDGKIENKTIALDNFTRPTGVNATTLEDGKIKFAPGAGVDAEIAVAIPAGTLANATSIEYHYTTTANATPDVQLYAAGPKDSSTQYAHQIKLGEGTKSSYGGSTKLKAGTSDAHIMLFNKTGSGAHCIYTRYYTVGGFKNNTQPSTYSTVPTDECKNAITEIRFKVYQFSTAGSGEYVTLDKIVITYDNSEATSAAAATENGSVTMFNNGGYAGDVIGFTTTPDPCYAIDTVTVTDTNGNDVALEQENYDAANLDNYYTFIQPTSNATVNVTFKFLGHTEVVDEAVAATCTQTGLTEGSHCSVCGVTIVAQEVVDALGHEWVDGEITYTDCTSDGNKAQSCSRCDATQTVAVAPKGHTSVAYEEVAATCTTIGYTGGTYCSECGAVIEARTEVPALGHTEGTPVDNGNGTHTVSCSVCGVTLRTENHNYVDGTCGCGNATYLLTDFETTVDGESAGEACDFAVSGTQATKLAAAHSYKTVKVNKNANYKDAEGISFWVYNAEDSAVSVWANLASTANVGSSGEELYFQRKYTVEPKVWTKLYIKFDYVNKQTAASSTNKKWGFDANNIAYNRAMTDEEIAGITNLYFAVDGGALKTVWFDDVYLWDDGKIENKTIALDNFTRPTGVNATTLEDGKIKFAPGAGVDAEIAVAIPAGTLANATSIEYHYTTTANATPDVQLYANGKDSSNNLWQIKLGEGTKSSYGGSTKLKAGTSDAHIMLFNKTGSGAHCIYTRYYNDVAGFKNNTQPSTYSTVPTEECKNAITEIRFKVYEFSTAGSGEYVTLDKIVITYDNSEATSAAAATENGSVTMFNNGGYAGDVIGFTTTPDPCYAIDTVTVTDAAGNDVALEQENYDAANLDNYYTFIQPTSNATVNVTFKFLGHTEGTPVEENRVEAGPGVAGSYDSVVYCTVCNAEISRTPVEIPAITDPYIDTLKIIGNNGSFESAYSLIYYVKESDVLAYDEFKIELSREQFVKDSEDKWVLSDERLVSYLTLNDIRRDENGNPIFLEYGDVNLYQFELKGIAPKEVANEIVAKIVATKNGHEFYGVEKNYNLVTFAMANINGTDEKFATAMISFLNYVAAAQECFGYNNATEADLANAGLTDEQKVVTLTEELTNDANNEGSGDITIVGFNVGFESQIELVVYLNSANDNYADKKLVINYENILGTSVTDEIDLTDITETINLTDNNGQDITLLVARYAGIAAKDMRAIVSMYVEDENGDKISNDRSYSLTTYAKKQADADSSIMPLTKALIVFGDAMNAWKSGS